MFTGEGRGRPSNGTYLYSVLKIIYKFYYKLSITLKGRGRPGEPTVPWIPWKN